MILLFVTWDLLHNALFFMFGFVRYELNSDLNALNQSKLSDISGSMISASNLVTIDAGKTADFTVTFPIPVGCRSIPFFAYVKSTGWAGLITQGTIVSMTKAEATFMLYNASTSQRTVKPQCVALFYKK